MKRSIYFFRTKSCKDSCLNLIKLLVWNLYFRLIHFLDAAVFEYYQSGYNE